jgi:hypothetical protein
LPFAFHTDGSTREDIFFSVGAVVEAGVPESTLLKDDLAWRRWCQYCELLRTPPGRMDLHAHSGADPIGFDRETRLQCGFLMWCYNLIVPKAKSDSAARPQSAYNMLAGVRRVHRRENMQMVAASRLAAVMKGITAQFIAENGAEALLPNRKEPIEPDLTRKLLTTAEGTVLGAVQLCWDSPLFLCLGAMIALAAGTGFRKAVVALPSGVEFDDCRLRRSSLLWEMTA